MGAAWNPETGLLEIRTALDTSDDAQFARLFAALRGHIEESRTPYPTAGAVQLLDLLRSRRRFRELRAIGLAFIERQQRAPTVQRHYAQSLIELGSFYDAELVLNALVIDAAERGDTKEYRDARGLLGRVYKQRYVASAAAGVHSAKDLGRAIDFYLTEYKQNRAENLYHGINAVALLKRARRDLVESGVADDPDAIARAILAQIEEAPRDSWDLATAMEAALALGDAERASEWLRRYVLGILVMKDRVVGDVAEARDASAAAAVETSSRSALAEVSPFYFASTLRQLQEVWQLDAKSPAGSLLLPALWAALLAADEGVDLEIGGSDVTDHATPGTFEGVYGVDRWVPVGWMRTGLACALSVGRISHTRIGRFKGTGFLLPGGLLRPELGAELVLLTNSHVVSEDHTVHNDRRYEPLHAADARVDLEGRPPIEGSRLTVLWESHPDKQDTTVMRIQDIPEIDGRINYVPRFNPLPQGGRTRIYTIGYPRGETQSFSLHHSKLIAANDHLLHYRTPTEEGSSGSPLFNQDWELVGIHHFSSTALKSLTTAGQTYAGNEGVWIERIRRAWAGGG